MLLWSPLDCIDMVHWASQKFSELERAVSGTGWMFNKPSSDKGPVVFNHTDGSEVSFVSSSISGGFAVEYEPASGVTEAITAHHTSWADLNNAMEWVVHTLERHESVN